MKRNRSLLLALVCLALARGDALARPKPTVIINKANNTLKLYLTRKKMKRFRVATGRFGCTPEGTFRVVQKREFQHAGNSPYGTNWLGLNTLGKRKRHRIGIHGTNEPKSIGKQASKGCIRLLNRDIKKLYRLVPIGARVRVVNVRYSRKHLKARPKTARNARRKIGLASVR